MATDTQVQVSDSDGEQIHVFEQVNGSGITYLIWSKGRHGANKSIHLWDSETESKQQIVKGLYSDPKIYVDKNGTINFFFQFIPYDGSICERHWDNVSQILTLIEPCGVDLVAALDGENNLHAVWGGGYLSRDTIHYWHTTQNITGSIATDNGVDFLNLVAGPDDLVHMIWQDTKSDREMHYSNSELLTDHFVTKSSFYILQSNNTVWDFDSSGKIHIAWVDNPNDNNIGYWTPVLSESIILTDTPLSSTNVNIHIDKQDKVHIVAVNNGNNKLFYWNDQMDDMKLVSDSNIENYTSWDFDSTGNIHIVWAGDPDYGEDYEIAYWNSNLSEAITLTEPTITSPYIKIGIDDQDEIHAAARVNGHKLLYWNGQLDDMQQISEGVENFVLFPETDGEASIFYLKYAEDLYYWNSELDTAEQWGYATQLNDIYDEAGWFYLYWLGSQQQYSSDSDMYAVWEDHKILEYEIYLPAIIK